jgi:hypothetical protein
MSKAILFLWLLLVSYSVNSQKPTCSCSLQGTLSAGLAAGASKTKPLFQASGGIKSGRYFAGIGGGVDLYRFKSIPVFADARWDFGRSGEGFLYGNLGYNFPFSNHSESNWFMDNWKTTDEFKGGYYFDAGIGYRIYLKGAGRLLVSAGFSQKRISNVTGFTYPCLVEPCPEEIYKYRYDLGRIVAKISWELSGKR